MIDSKLKDKKEKTTDDVDAYDLIMKIKSFFLTEIRRGLQYVLSSRTQRFVKDGIIRMYSRFVL